jgi:hypothetical protein
MEALLRPARLSPLYETRADTDSANVGKVLSFGESRGPARQHQLK